MAKSFCSGGALRSRNSTILILMNIIGVVFGFFMGVSFRTLSHVRRYNSYYMKMEDVARLLPKIHVAANPRGSESLPPGIVVRESDLYARRLWGIPSQDLQKEPPKYLVTFTVGIAQKETVNAAVQKFSPHNFTVLLFHYDNHTNEWDEYEWSKKAIHITVTKQAKWWYAKRFLHPDVIAAYEYVFIWDEDIGVDHFDPLKYIELAKKHGLEISQPALDHSQGGVTWDMTKRRFSGEAHKKTTGKPVWCKNTNLPPCAGYGFVEIMAPVFTKTAWRCVWYLIQNDLVHGWGLDFNLRRCAEPAHEKMGVIDAQWIVHQKIPSLGNQGEEQNGSPAWRGVRDRCYYEWRLFQKRLNNADQAYFNSTST